MTAEHTGPAPSESLMPQQRLLRIAARALGRAGLSSAYGHCSMRIDAHHFLVCAAKPLGKIRDIDSGALVPITGSLPDGVLGEVRIHQNIYRAHPSVNAVTRTMPPYVMTLSTARRTPSRRHGPGSYFPRTIPLWDDPQLIRSDAQAREVVETMGTSNVIVMRGNGAVMAADSIERAVVLTWYLEDAARVEWQLLAAGLAANAPVLSDDDAARRAVTSGGIFERMWDYLCASDPELAEPASHRHHE
jgi:HCOMODA/2-hydroxy-3-carboxy-muconic semialdehyde decarboxylase